MNFCAARATIRFLRPRGGALGEDESSAIVLTFWHLSTETRYDSSNIPSFRPVSVSTVDQYTSSVGIACATVGVKSSILVKKSAISAACCAWCPSAMVTGFNFFIFYQVCAASARAMDEDSDSVLVLEPVLKKHRREPTLWDGLSTWVEYVAVVV